MNVANFAIDLALKSILFLTLIFLAMPLLRRASAAVRHFVWLATLLALLALPFLSAALPGWHILPARRTPSPASASIPLGMSALLGEFSSGQSVALVETSSASDDSGAFPVTNIFDESWLRASLIFLIPCLWFCGVCIALAPLFLGWLSLRCLEGRAFTNTDESCLNSLNSCMLRLETFQPITLLESSDRAMPMTWGVFNPRILLPDQARQWPAQRREFALLHELAHVKRYDNLVNYIVRFVCALYWFNPLVWVAAGKLRLECEQACDDLVVSCCRDAGDYADELLELSTTPGFQSFTPLVASPMARQSTLEKRLLAILDDNLNHTPMKRSQFTVVIALIAAAIVPVSIISAASAEAQNDSAAPSITATSANEEIILKSFTVSDGGTLKMNVDQGSIEVTSAEGNKIGVMVRRKVKNAGDSDVASFLAQHPVEFAQSGSDLTITAKNPDNKSWSGHHPDLEVEYKITVPQKYNLNLSSGGGNIEAGRVDGAAQLRTGGGNIDAYECQSLQAESGGGNIEVKSIHGDVVAHTGGGSARVTDCSGSLDAKSGGGNLTLENIGGPSVQGDTGGGSISSDLASIAKDKCEFKSGGGNIHLKLPSDAAFKIDAATGGGSVKSDLPVERTDNPKSTDTLRGSVNGGGPELKIRTGGGEILISKR